MTEEQRKQIVEALVSFITRVAEKNETTSEKEIEVLPEVIRELARLEYGVLL